MKELIAVDIDESIRGVRDAGKGRRVLWQDSESIAFLSRGRKLRKVLPLAVARKMEDFAAVGTNAG